MLEGRIAGDGGVCRASVEAQAVVVCPKCRALYDPENAGRMIAIGIVAVFMGGVASAVIASLIAGR